MLKKSKKLWVSLGLAAVVASTPVSVMAQEDAGAGLIRLQNVNVSDMEAGLQISAGGTANLHTAVSGKFGISKIKLTMKLQKYEDGSWNNVKSWDTTVSSSYAALDKSCHLGGRGTYRCKLKASVWKGGTEETITKASTSKTY